MIFLVYPLLIAALVTGLKFYKYREWNEEAFSLRQMKAVQGFATICIMLHHCGQKTSASWIDKQYYHPGLEPFVPIGYVLVSIFTFCAGYGVYKSLKTKDNYLRHFIGRRIMPIVILGYAVALLMIPVRFFLGEDLHGLKLVWYLTGLKLSNPNSWYVIVIPFFYLCFYLAFRFIKNEKIALITVFIFTICYQLLGVSIDHNDWWMRGEWWYNSVLPFAVGILFSMYEEKIVEHLKRNYVKYVIFGLISIFVFYFLRNFATSFFSYYGENWGAPDKILRRIICLISEELFALSVVFYIFLLGMKIRFGNRFLNFMGTITLEFYLIHGLYSEMFSYAFDGKLRPLYYIKQNALYVLVVFVLGLASALLIKLIEEGLKKLKGQEGIMKWQKKKKPT